MDEEQSRETQTELELLHVGNMCKPAADCQSRLYSHATEQVHVMSVKIAWALFLAVLQWISDVTFMF